MRIFRSTVLAGEVVLWREQLRMVPGFLAWKISRKDWGLIRCQWTAVPRPHEYLSR